MKASMDEFERLAAQQQGSQGGQAGPGATGQSTGSGRGDDDGEVIIVHEVRD